MPIHNHISNYHTSYCIMDIGPVQVILMPCAHHHDGVQLVWYTRWVALRYGTSDLSNGCCVMALSFRQHQCLPEASGCTCPAHVCLLLVIAPMCGTIHAIHPKTSAAYVHELIHLEYQVIYS